MQFMLYERSIFSPAHPTDDVNNIHKNLEIFKKTIFCLCLKGFYPYI